MIPTEIQMNRRQRGFSLPEVLVATAIFAIIMVAALMLYDRSSKNFKEGMEAADTQQNSRVGFDKLVQDLRMTGFDYDRDGVPTSAANAIWEAGKLYNKGTTVSPTVANGLSYVAIQAAAGTSDAVEPAWPVAPGETVGDGTVTWQAQQGTNRYQQPDEQIEYAGPTAIVVRGNFDYEIDAANENGRETEEGYESPQFPVVTTGNDEIVGYALVSENEEANSDSITFFADTSIPRDAYPGGGDEEEITIDGVDLSHDNPPYTLYRFTVKTDAGATSVERAPLANNIRSLGFLYYQDLSGTSPLKDIDGNEVPDGTDIEGDGEFVPANAATLVPERTVRSRILSVRANLVGMSAAKDAKYQDPYETLEEFKSYRKNRLESLVAPRNAQKRGTREDDSTPPAAPFITKLCLGACGIATLEWQAPTTGGTVEQYAIVYQAAGGGFEQISQVGPATSGSVFQLEPDKEYTFKVKAINSYGSADSNEITGTPKNRTRPAALEALNVESGTNELVLTWQRPSANDPAQESLSCSDGTTPNPPLPPGEIRGYRVTRYLAENEPVGDGVVVWSETESGPDLTVAASGAVTFHDRKAAMCVDYYYRVQTVDYCGSAADNPTFHEEGFTGIATIYPSDDPFEPAIGATGADPGLTPAAPADLVVTSSTCPAGVTGVCAQLTWPRVKLADDGTTAMIIDRYNIYRTTLRNGTPDATTTVNRGPMTGISQDLTDANPIFKDEEGLPLTDVTSGESLTYRYEVKAEHCAKEGGASPQRIFPCEASLGTLGFTLDAAFVDGSGTSTDPYIFNDSGSVTVSASAGEIKTLTATVYVDGAPMAPITIDAPGPFSFPIESTTDEEVFVIYVTAEDANGCTTSGAMFANATSNTSCLTGTTPVLDPVTRKILTMRLENICSTSLTIDNFRVTWSSSVTSPPQRADSATYPGNATHDFPNEAGTFETSPASAAGAVTTIAAGSIETPGTYEVSFNFLRQEPSGAQPITGVCVTFTHPTEGTKTVKVHGTGTSCP